jgi:hypothetical protein
VYSQWDIYGSKLDLDAMTVNKYFDLSSAAADGMSMTVTYHHKND